MKFFYIFWAILLLPVLSYAQRNCGTDLYTQGVLNSHRELTYRYGRALGDDTIRREVPVLNGVITIPIAFHIIYRTDDEKISRELIDKQVAQLNDDFAGRNAIVNNLPPEYRSRIADCEIRFLTDTVFYIHTDTVRFNLRAASYSQRYESIKFTRRGGHNALPSTKFLNVWVGNITDGSSNQLLGYATFPGGDNTFDGVVIYYKAFSLQTAMPQFDLGRTLTHEVGHWLNLRHIWGDAQCGDDFVEDTPPQEHANAHCPLCPCRSACSPPETGDMFMNYMDYVDDKCMYMFTKGQKERMRANFIEYGGRASFIHGVDDNAVLLVAGGRLDTNTTTIKEVVNSQDQAIIKWDSVIGAARYKILAKKVSDSTWTEITTVNTKATITGLKSAQLYEVKVETVSGDGKVSPESTSYLFTAGQGSQSPSVNRNLRIR